ncbi:MAG TPA: ceramidase domain-containing protein [Chitinophagales bacterium]|nr:MAG: hypothetical protein E6Q95_04155 [Chitinophagaceae bacterium]HNC73117.1 ceramidase domain-containing protein [Chitinophagales bacterium]
MIKNAFKISIVFTVFILLLFYIAISTAWFGISTGVGGDFCEAARNGLIKQPANSYSNIGFLISGLACAWILSHKDIDKSGAFFKHPFIPLFYCLITILLGPCSMAMHATETALGGLFDMNSMYLFGSFMFAFALARYYKLHSFVFVILYFSSVFLCNYAGTFKTVFGYNFFPGSAAFGVVCVLGMLFEILNYKKNKPDIQFKYAIYCSLSFLVGFGVWQFGYDGHCFCNPNSLFQWHGVWHLLCALSTYFLFQFYISEKTPE